MHIISLIFDLTTKVSIVWEAICTRPKLQGLKGLKFRDYPAVEGLNLACLWVGITTIGMGHWVSKPDLSVSFPFTLSQLMFSALSPFYLKFF